MDAKFGKAEDYVGKWCLYKQYMHSPYSSVFVLCAKDGIVKIVYENSPETFMYEEWDYFEDCCRFFVNPIDMPPPKAALKMPDSASDRPDTPAKEDGTESDAHGPHGCMDSKGPSTEDARVGATCSATDGAASTTAEDTARRPCTLPTPRSTGDATTPAMPPPCRVLHIARTSAEGCVAAKRRPPRAARTGGRQSGQ